MALYRYSAHSNPSAPKVYRSGAHPYIFHLKAALSSVSHYRFNPWMNPVTLSILWTKTNLAPLCTLKMRGLFLMVVKASPTFWKPDQPVQSVGPTYLNSTLVSPQNLLVHKTRLNHTKPAKPPHDQQTARNVRGSKNLVCWGDWHNLRTLFCWLASGR